MQQKETDLREKIEKNQELLALLHGDVPSLMMDHPWIESFLCEQGQFLRKMKEDTMNCPPKRRRWPFVVITLVVVLAAMATLINLRSFQASYQLETGGKEPIKLMNIPMVDERSMSSHSQENVASSSDVPTGCQGDESLCVVTVTGHPDQTLRQLIAAIPKGNAKQYKVFLSVVPVEEEETTVEATVAQ